MYEGYFSDETPLLISHISITNTLAVLTLASLRSSQRLLKVAPTFMERNFPIISAILPSNSHEVVLYIINFLMICQGYNVWQNWRHSPVAGAIRRWQSTGLNKMLRKRELRRIARRAEKELARGEKIRGV